MKFDAYFRPGDEVRALWLLVAAILIAGSLYVHNRYQTAIAYSYDRSEVLYRDTVADNRIIAQAVVLTRLKRRAQADLVRVAHETTLSASTANLLSTLHASAARFSTRITAVQPGETTVSEASQGLPALQGSPLTIRLRGRFRDTLRFVEDLSHHSTLISVLDTGMSLAHDAGTDTSQPLLDATVHATLYRLRLPEEREASLAAAQ